MGGIIHESDINNIRPEFVQWAIEVKNLRADNLLNRDVQFLFNEFVENFNTASMPHTKYYSLSNYTSSIHDIKSPSNLSLPLEDERAIFVDDEANRKEEIDLQKKKASEDRLLLALEELKHSQKTYAMRNQEMLKQRLAL